jgi:hypothetical protein
MPTRAGPVYEVTLFVGRDDVAACDQWLDEHARMAQLLPAVASCHVCAVADDDAGRAGRVCRYQLASDDVLDDFLDRTAGDIESTVAARFGEHSEVHARVLREDLTHDLPLSEQPNCLNCGTHLRGQYCGHCGQRSRSRLISLWELVRDAFGDMFELDSRLWQTVVPLLTRPGRLTHDYLQGRRARYMPPFRMYLVLSLIFFVVAFFDPREEFGFFFEPPEQVTAETANEKKPGLRITIDDDDGEKVEGDCDELENEGVDKLPAFLARRLSVERLTQLCEHIAADEGKSLSAKVINNTPTALIVLLPLMALVLKVLYPLSRRYYVEHLLFFVHFHAFVFLLLTLQILLTRLAGPLHIPEAATTTTIVATSLYIPAYVLVAMRRVYGQGRIVSFLKFTALALAYVTGFSLVFLITFLIAAFSI